MRVDETLILKAAALARSASPQWQEFLKALDGFAEDHRHKLLASPVTELPAKQGRAQSITELHNLLSNKLFEAADTINKRESKK